MHRVLAVQEARAPNPTCLRVNSNSLDFIKVCPFTLSMGTLFSTKIPTDNCCTRS